MNSQLDRKEKIMSTLAHQYIAHRLNRQAEAERHAEIDAHAERCKAETRAIVQEALDRISIKVGFWMQGARLLTKTCRTRE